MAGQISRLGGRGVVRASGADAVKLLDGLVTNETGLLGRQPAIHAALLSPQGKILFAFFIVAAGDDLLLDVAADRAADLVRRLTFYKLRAAAVFEDISTGMAVATAAPDATPTIPRGVIAFPDPRHPEMGSRLILPEGRLAEIGINAHSADAYHERRVALGVPDEGADYTLGDAFPHEADLDLCHGVSFTKGCFIGQEVVARMQNKTVVRKRVVRIAGNDLRHGAEIHHGEGVIGTVGTVVGDRALAMLRLDRAAEAADKGEALIAGGQPVTVEAEALTRYRDSVRNRPVVDL